MKPITRRTMLLSPCLAGAWAPPAAADPALWSAEFQQPSGQALKLASFRGRWLVLNFWATWCAPCIKELPDFDQFHRDEQARPGREGWQVVGLAVDGPTPVRDFLKRRPVSFPIGLAGMNGTDLMKKLGNSRGGLPFTVIANLKGEIVWRRPGETPLALLREQRQKLAAS
ncbi:MAG: TlpA family protein disulfide reductase [Burkholderiales bacterium]|uniref:TlpA family protein disulfide reductase n=1 Tax=Inhella sp. TaxID=1921806 RepID=UPI001AC957E8|nr:TlpA family protein disulfide reductase [Burkholderiales bacterium]